MQVLEDGRFAIPFGETIAIVGPNGCGKSTLANLVPRFYDPLEGASRIDGVDLRDVRLQTSQADRPGHTRDAALRRHGSQQHSLRFAAPRVSK